MSLTPLGTFHTAVSVLAVILAFVALFKDRKISPLTGFGRAYLVALWITTLTGFPIFRHGTIGPPHILGAVTVGVLLLAAIAGKTRVFGRAAAYVETLCYSSTVFFLMIPAFTETLTRLPVEAPIAASPEAPLLQAINLVLVGLLLAGASVQVRGLRRSRLG